MDLLDSIMTKMDKPPGLDDKQKKLRKEQQKAMEEMKIKEREMLGQFRKDIEERIGHFVQDGACCKKKFEPMTPVGRSILRDVADVAGLTSYVFGLEEEERHVMVFKKSYPLSDDELTSLRNGEEWDPVTAKINADMKCRQSIEDKERLKKMKKEKGPNKYIEKYTRLVGSTTELEVARVLDSNNKQYGFVNSEQKKDKRTIEETLADIRAKKQKVLHEDDHPNTP